MKASVPLTQTFDEVRNLIYSRVNIFYRKYKLNREDLISAAFLGFMQAYDTFDPKIGEFSTWVCHKVDNRLKDELKAVIDRQNRKTYTGFEQHYLELIPKKEIYQDFDPVEWLERLNEDARRVASVVLTKPIDIKLLLGQLGGETSHNWRQALREFLAEIEWDSDRIKATFASIKEAL